MLVGYSKLTRRDAESQGCSEMLQSKERTMKGVGFKARVEAFFEEFSFLGRYVDKAMVGEIPKVSRVNLELLDTCGWTLDWMNNLYLEAPAQSWVKATGKRSFFILDKNGVELTTVRPADVVKTPRAGKLWGIFPRVSVEITEIKPESVLEAIQRLPDQNQIRFILEVEDKRPRWERRRGTPGFIVAIYKVPAGEPLSSWISRLKEVARHELSLAIKDIDELK